MPVSNIINPPIEAGSPIETGCHDAVIDQCY